jgi:hypothetical protein
MAEVDGQDGVVDHARLDPEHAAPPSGAELVDLVLDEGLGGGQPVGLAAQERLGEALGLLELDLPGDRATWAKSMLRS